LLSFRHDHFLLVKPTYRLASKDVIGQPAVFFFYRVKVLGQRLLAAPQRTGYLVVETPRAE
jgi:hypothetical protein